MAFFILIVVLVSFVIAITSLPTPNDYKVTGLEKYGAKGKLNFILLLVRYVLFNNRFYYLLIMYYDRR